MPINDYPAQVPGHPLPDWPDWCETYKERRAYQQGIGDARRMAASVPIPMILHCPACHTQHIDKAETFSPTPYACTCAGPDTCGECEAAEEAYREWLAEGPWLNPPHRSHLCHQCGHVWRPADVPTTGVLAIETKGKADSPPALGTKWGVPFYADDQPEGVK